MNLWALFPSRILNIDGILYLPYLAFLLYAVVFIFLVKCSELRTKLLLFVSISVFINSFILATIGPSMGTVIIPLLLLGLILIPCTWLVLALKAKNNQHNIVYSLLLLTALVHGLSWGVWISALARS